MRALTATTRNRRRNNRHHHHYNFKFPTTPFFHKFIFIKSNFSSKKKKSSVLRIHQLPRAVVVPSSSLPSVVVVAHPHSTESSKLGLPGKCRKRKRAFLRLRFSNWFDKGERKRKYSMGNALSYCFGFGKAKKHGASVRRLRDKKYSEVIDPDAKEDVRINQGYDDDSSIEEIEVLDDGREGCSKRVIGKHKAMINGEYVDEKNVKTHMKECCMRSGDTDYEEELLSRLSVGQTIKKSEKAGLREAFVPLTEEEHNEITRAFSGERSRVLVIHQKSNIEITGEVIQCLRPRAWLNDEVINVYLELLKEREKRDPKYFLRCHFFNTFFYRKLMSGKDGYDFTCVRRWTSQRKLDYSLKDCDKIFVPIHKEAHWCLGVINVKDTRFQYLDSFGIADPKVLRNLARYFVDEVKDKDGIDVDVSYWKHEVVKDLPYQENGWDCGMFMIKYADFYSRGGGLYFDQRHMPYFRQRTVKEILRLKAD